MEVPREIVEKVLNEVVERFLKPKFIELGMNASGDWLNALEVRGNEIWGMDYTEYLVRGRGGNEDQSDEAVWRWAKWAAATFIKDWVSAKGIDNKLAFPIAYKIAKEGTSYYPNGTDLLEVLESREVKEFVMRELSQYMIKEVQQTFVRQAKQILV